MKHQTENSEYRLALPSRARELLKEIQAERLRVDGRKPSLTEIAFVAIRKYRDEICGDSQTE